MSFMVKVHYLADICDLVILEKLLIGNYQGIIDNNFIINIHVNIE